MAPTPHSMLLLLRPAAALGSGAHGAGVGAASAVSDCVVAVCDNVMHASGCSCAQEGTAKFYEKYFSVIDDIFDFVNLVPESHLDIHETER